MEDLLVNHLHSHKAPNSKQDKLSNPKKSPMDSSQATKHSPKTIMA